MCLPGPHDEVKLLWPVLKHGLQDLWDVVSLANALAGRLREKFLSSAAHSANVIQDKVMEVFNGPH